MKKIIFVAFCALFLFGCATQTPSSYTPISYVKLNVHAPIVSYSNAFWFQPSDPASPLSEPAFVRKTMHTKNGVFVDEAPENAVEIDLQGAYVITPFGEANNYFLDQDSSLDTANRYLKAGVFYLKNARNKAPDIAKIRQYWERADTLDVAFSNGGILLSKSDKKQVDDQASETSVDDSVSTIKTVSTVEEFQTHWPTILLGARTDFAKLYLTMRGSNTELGESERAEILDNAARLARAAKLPISVEVSSVTDLELGLTTGARELTLAMNYPTVESLKNVSVISEELMEGIVTQKMVIVTMARGINLEYADRPELLSEIQKVYKQILRQLYDANALIAIGTHSPDETLASEVAALRSMGVFSDQELLSLMMQTPKLSVFPDRALGSFAAGHEASFIGLECNPFEEFSCTQKITHRIKQGMDLSALITP